MTTPSERKSRGRFRLRGTRTRDARTAPRAATRRSLTQVFSAPPKDLLRASGDAWTLSASHQNIIARDNVDGLHPRFSNGPVSTTGWCARRCRGVCRRSRTCHRLDRLLEAGIGSPVRGSIPRGPQLDSSAWSEQRIRNPSVVGSIPTPDRIGIVQLVRTIVLDT